MVRVRWIFFTRFTYRFLSTESIKIDFNRTVADNCPAFSIKPEAPPPDFTAHYLYGKDDQTVFTVDIGQAGSEQGYKAITGG